MPGSSIGGHFVTARTILGIDPGAHGTIAVLDEGGDLLEVVDMPSLPEASGRSATNAPLLAGILARTHARIAFCEFVGASPTDAKVAAFAFGRAHAVIEGCAGVLGVPIVFLTPPTWKRVADIPPGAENKDLARTRANRAVARARRSLCTQARRRPRRGLPDRARRIEAEGAACLSANASRNAAKLNFVDVAHAGRRWTAVVASVAHQSGGSRNTAMPSPAGLQARRLRHSCWSTENQTGSRLAVCAVRSDRETA
jgi:hypothetical protein